ncbi:hypothetical protein [Desulfovibrio sp. Huiquan2017]|uniref:hypothetical protein n=1 Tax=Desulfovibrio sp. Huiquan2017 TaxID=2816861 RepID=UPI001A92234F|nr:hypothetical protein [Desulfovibrio sp. Huiquan2017]
MPSLYYDKNDYRLLEIVEDVLSRGVDKTQFKTLLEPYLKPHGIKELAADRGLRIAYAIMHLLESLKSEQASDRTKALIALRDETLTAAKGAMRNNRARVLVQIGKELVRAKGDRCRQLALAHDFRRAAAGKIGFLRQQMRRYHLLEMPEEWNQITFDDRVHDANSKGRKSATHLVMDAWIKGIRYLTVVYYDCVDLPVARELLASAAILGIKVRIGIEYRALHRGRFVKIVWCPGGLRDDCDIEGLFRVDAVRELMEQGREVRGSRSEYVRAVTEAFNTRHRQSIQKEFGVLLPPVDYDEMAVAAGVEQPSILHLGNYIHAQAMPFFEERVASLRKGFDQADYDAKAAIAVQVESLDALDVDTMVARYLSPEENRDIPDPDRPRAEGLPALLSLSPAELTSRLRRAAHSSHLTLILADLELEDALELLFQCQGRISHLEVFNTKHLEPGQTRLRMPFSQLQQALNEQNAVKLKRLIRGCMDSVRAKDGEEAEDRLRALEGILERFDRLLEFYKRVPLGTSIGSGSTGRSTRTHGMGFAVLETLPLRGQREAARLRAADRIPVQGTTIRSNEYVMPKPGKGLWGRMIHMAAQVTGLRRLVCRTCCRWRVDGYAVTEAGGNVVALGGKRREGNGLSLFAPADSCKRRPSPDQLNSVLKNVIKVLAGFIPAFLTFYLTKDWWILAYFGGIIWFSITGLRNVIQSVLGGGGLRRSPFLAWNDYIDWERIADSLLYTGFSVPLLDWLCKSVVLDKGLGVTTATNPLLLYSIMALTNGVYISSHNVIRGLPREAAAANFFRSVLSIPIAMLFNWGAQGLLVLGGSVDPMAVLQLWAAVISKLASDCVAGVIEGFADRRRNIAMRRWDYTEKLHQVFEIYSRLEIAFPTRDMLGMLNRPAEFIDFSRESNFNHVPEVIANALDMLYIMAYKPRAHEALRQALEAMSEDEVAVFLASQQVLREEQSVSMLFVNGLVGRNFAKGLSFYLTRYSAYLDEIGKMAAEALGKMAGDGSEAPSPDGVPSREEDGLTHSCRGYER